MQPLSFCKEINEKKVEQLAPIYREALIQGRRIVPISLPIKCLEEITYNKVISEFSNKTFTFQDSLFLCIDLHSTISSLPREIVLHILALKTMVTYPSYEKFGKKLFPDAIEIEEGNDFQEKLDKYTAKALLSLNISPRESTCPIPIDEDDQKYKIPICRDHNNEKYKNVNYHEHYSVNGKGIEYKKRWV